MKRLILLVILLTTIAYAQTNKVVSSTYIKATIADSMAVERAARTTVDDSLASDIATIVAGTFDTTYVYEVTDSLAADIVDLIAVDDSLASDIADLVVVDDSLASDIVDLIATDDSLAADIKEIKMLSLVKTDPDSATSFTLLRTKYAITIDSVFALVQGASATVDFNLAYGTDRTSGTDVFSGDQTSDNVTVGETFSSFSSATIPISNMLWLDLNDTANTPEEFLCVIYYH